MHKHYLSLYGKPCLFHVTWFSLIKCAWGNRLKRAIYYSIFIYLFIFSGESQVSSYEWIQKKIPAAKRSKRLSFNGHCSLSKVSHKEGRDTTTTPALFCIRGRTMYLKSLLWKLESINMQKKILITTCHLFLYRTILQLQCGQASFQMWHDDYI